MSAAERALAVELGELYESLTRLLQANHEPGVQRREVSRLCDRYTKANVEWMLGVVKDDLAIDA